MFVYSTLFLNIFKSEIPRVNGLSKISKYSWTAAFLEKQDIFFSFPRSFHDTVHIVNLLILFTPILKAPFRRGLYFYFVLFASLNNTTIGKRMIHNAAIVAPPLPHEIIQNFSYCSHKAKNDRKHARIKHEYFHFIPPLRCKDKQITNTAGDGVKLPVYIIPHYNTV